MSRGLDDTPVDQAALDETVTDVELDESLDRVDTQPDPTAKKPDAPESPDDTEYDPEAHYTNIRNKQSVRKVVSSDGGQFVIGVVLAFVGVAVGIYAAVLQTKFWIITAVIVCPPTLIYAFMRWRMWLGQAPYLYRLLTSLGEDADDLLETHRQKMISRGRLPSDDDLPDPD
jgi:hypothetical protein